MDSSREADPRTSKKRRFWMHVPTPLLPMTFSRPSASMWARKGESNRPSPFTPITSGWPTKCFYRGMRTAMSGTSGFDLVQWQFRTGRTMLSSKR
jgi:hypothetical protein